MADSRRMSESGRLMKTLTILSLIAAMNITAIAQTSTSPAKDAAQTTVLQVRVGQQVELRLKSGEKISGKLQSVGDNIVHLIALTGMEFFEATVSISDISAVVVRTATK